MIKTTHGVHDIGRVGRDQWLAVIRFNNNPVSPAMWAFWKVEYDFTIRPKALSNKQRREEYMTELVRLAGRRCLPNSPKGQIHSDASWLDKILNRSHSRVKHCALLSTYLNDIVTDATPQLRDLLWIGIRMLFLAREAEEVKTLLGIEHSPDK